MMKLQHNESTGIAAMKAEPYNTPISSEIQRQNTERAWWSTPAFIIFLTVSMSVLDALVLFDILDQAMTQAEYMGKVVAYGVALILNMIPLLVAKFAHQAIYGIKKYAFAWAIVGIASFLILFSATVMLRFAYQDQYGSGDSYHITNEMSVQEEIADTEGTDPKGLSVVLLLSLEPLVTSAVNFLLAFLSEDEVRRRIEYLRKRRLEISEAVSELRAYIETAEDPEVWRARMLTKESELRSASEAAIRDRGEILKSRARSFLAEELKDPESVSYVISNGTTA